jgi:hypothetical protein
LHIQVFDEKQRVFYFNWGIPSPSASHLTSSYCLPSGNVYILEYDDTCAPNSEDFAIHLGIESGTSSYESHLGMLWSLKWCQDFGRDNLQLSAPPRFSKEY